MDWIVENKEAIWAIVFFAASEIIGISPLRSNSVVQLALSALRAVTKPKKG
jgi:hypothetical protein